MTGSHQRDKSAEAFWRQLSLKEVHLSSCLKQNLFPPRLIRTVVGGRGPDLPETNLGSRDAKPVQDI